MKRMTLRAGMLVFLIASCVCASQIVCADVEWTIVNQIDLGGEPLDSATSADGGLVFVLVPGEVLIYSISENRLTDHIPVDAVFNRLSHSRRYDRLILTSSTAKTLRVIQLEHVYDIAVSGLPFKGAADAPVTIAVFSDYQ